ncbi:hypothetical protein SOM55_09140 [Pseudomonas coleopterorum]|nr:hypothetical protein [Pseudomonas coleopterorum]MDY1046964.1 hypothetical protein [Pseudomonas coleopterorum]
MRFGAPWSQTCCCLDGHYFIAETFDKAGSEAFTVDTFGLE